MEIDAPAPLPTNVPTLATSATAACVDGGSRVSAATQGATTRPTSTFASVIWFEFTGPGGTGTVGVADNQRYGQGCYSHAVSCYEPFANSAAGHAFDLRILFVGGAASVQTPVVIPAGTFWIGASLQAQSAALVAGVNALGALTSNGLQFTVGNF